jgi:hypothetical protein
MSLQMSLPLTLNAISSPESESGVTPSVEQDGPTIAPCGQVVAHANLSARQAKAAGLLTSGTYGQHSFGSSASVALRQSLASKLHQRMDSDGGILFRLTWKDRVTPAGQQIYALRASGHHTSGSASTGWPTPRASESEKDSRSIEGGLKEFARGKSPSVSTVATLLAPWPTPVANDDNKSPEAHLAMKQRMGERDGTGSHRTQITSLQVMAKTVTHWRTPTSCSPNSLRGNGQDPEKRKAGGHTINLQDEVRLLDPGTTPNGSTVETAKRGQLNPAFSRWLQGLPPEWDVAAILAFRNRKARQKGG